MVVTAGGTREAIDPVRYFSNRSSGKQGYALAQAALDAGAQVTLIVSTVETAGWSRSWFRCSRQRDMLDAVLEHIPGAAC